MDLPRNEEELELYFLLETVRDAKRNAQNGVYMQHIAEQRFVELRELYLNRLRKYEQSRDTPSPNG